jgi:hypothetical protein
MDEERNSQKSESKRLENLYRKAADPVLRTHLLMVWRMSVGDSVGEVAELVGYSKKWTKEIERRYDSEGVVRDSVIVATAIPGPRRGLCSTRRDKHSSVGLFWRVRPRAGGCGVGLRWRAGSNRETAWRRCTSSGVLST